MPGVTQMDYLVVPVPRTCSRCGRDFRTSCGERVCRLCRMPRVKDRPRSRELSSRERQVVALVQRAKLNKEIAFELRLTEGTIKEYLHTIFRKLEVKNRTELAIWAHNNVSRLHMMPMLEGRLSETGTR